MRLLPIVLASVWLTYPAFSQAAESWNASSGPQQCILSYSLPQGGTFSLQWQHKDQVMVSVSRQHAPESVPVLPQLHLDQDTFPLSPPVPAGPGRVSFFQGRNAGAQILASLNASKRLQITGLGTPLDLDVWQAQQALEKLNACATRLQIVHPVRVLYENEHTQVVHHDQRCSLRIKGSGQTTITLDLFAQKSLELSVASPLLNIETGMSITGALELPDATLPIAYQVLSPMVLRGTFYGRESRDRFLKALEHPTRWGLSFNERPGVEPLHHDLRSSVTALKHCVKRLEPITPEGSIPSFWR